MDIPANGGARLSEDVVVDTRYIYMLALALVGLALATCAILFLMIAFLKAMATLSGCRASRPRVGGCVSFPAPLCTVRLRYQRGSVNIAACRKNILCYTSSRPFWWSSGYSVYSRFHGR